MTTELIPAIGFCGEAQSGKDTAASFLVKEYGYERIAFADPLKEEFAAQLAGSEDPAWLKCLERNTMSLVWTLAALDWMAAEDMSSAAEYINANKQDFRSLLQLYGTDFRRAQDPDYWIKKTASMLKPEGRYVFTDVRFPNEIRLVRSLGGVVCCIHRKNAGANGIQGHPSERVDRLERDVDIWNDNTIAALGQIVLGLAKWPTAAAA